MLECQMLFGNIDKFTATFIEIFLFRDSDLKHSLASSFLAVYISRLDANRIGRFFRQNTVDELSCHFCISRKLHEQLRVGFSLLKGVAQLLTLDETAAVRGLLAVSFQDNSLEILDDARCILFLNNLFQSLGKAANRPKLKLDNFSLVQVEVKVLSALVAVIVDILDV